MSSEISLALRRQRTFFTKLSPICVKYDPKGHALMSEPDFIYGDYTIKWQEEWLAKRTG